MDTATLLQSLRGPFHFLRPDLAELQALFPDSHRVLPTPQRIYLEDETSTPVLGFPILAAPSLQELQAALEAYVEAEEEVQLRVFWRSHFDRRAYELAWERYRSLLARAVENITISSYGRQLPAIFWLYHSGGVARCLKETPRRIVRRDLELGREHGDEIKYRVFHRYLDRVLALTYDAVSRLADETEEVEEELFPPLLTRMRDNVLILTEDYIGPDLAELGSYLSGHLDIDGKELRSRLMAVAEWHAEELAEEADLRSVVEHLWGGAGVQPEDLLKRPGYLSYLATRSSYDPRRLLPPDLVRVWESLLLKLKEFELLQAFRLLMIPVYKDGEQLICRDPTARGTGSAARQLRLSPTTRPLDFLSPWVVDPQADRYGMIYDIADFSELVSVLRRSGSGDQDHSFRAIFRFQRRVNRLALSHRLKLEKYLGDGAFYSGRDPVRPLIAAIQLQRYYRRTLQEGFPFDRGLRIALNYGHYRLLPIQGEAGEGQRYEFFGHGVVELSRLVTGKASREIDEIKTLLISLGYPADEVDRFFAPMMERNVDLVDKREEDREFYAYINQNGALVNEGIVATDSYITKLDEQDPFECLYRARDGGRTYLVLPLDEGGERIYAGVRKLGMASFKGLDRQAVYEITDAQELAAQGLEELPETNLVEALGRQAAASMGGRSRARGRA